jgi:hypothetical protein
MDAFEADNEVGACMVGNGGQRYRALSCHDESCMYKQNRGLGFQKTSIYGGSYERGGRKIEVPARSKLRPWRREPGRIAVRLGEEASADSQHKGRTALLTFTS